MGHGSALTAWCLSTGAKNALEYGCLLSQAGARVGVKGDQGYIGARRAAQVNPPKRAEQKSSQPPPQHPCLEEGIISSSLSASVTCSSRVHGSRKHGGNMLSGHLGLPAHSLWGLQPEKCPRMARRGPGAGRHGQAPGPSGGEALTVIWKWALCEVRERQCPQGTQSPESQPWLCATSDFPRGPDESLSLLGPQEPHDIQLMPRMFCRQALETEDLPALAGVPCPA